MSTKPPSTTVRTYLLLYNALCLTLWTTITLRLFLLLLALLLPPTAHLPAIHAAFFPLLQVTQSLALLEIVHAAMGIVRAALGTTAMQVASRLVVVYGVMGMFAGDGEKRGILGGRETRARVGDWGFVGCVTAWGVTECVRYGFFVVQIWGGRVPTGWVRWLRYNTFFVLYPIGIASECALMYLALEPAALVHPLLPWVFKGILLVYIPGSYVLYTHMMAQRRKVMNAAATKSN